MSKGESATQRYRRALEEAYAARFPRSVESFEKQGRSLLDRTSHAIRWNEPFMPLVREATGAWVRDLDDHRILDYWQGHFTNLLGHNPPLVREVLSRALDEGRGLQTGMVHEIEWEVAEEICRATGAETARLTTSGSLGTFYSVVLARAFTGRDVVLKVAGGWHGSQPFGLKGVAAGKGSFDHLESEGLPSSTGDEVALTRFNDEQDLRRAFDAAGDRIACFLVEPVLGSGGGIAASPEYLRAARALTEKHGALLLCDEIITGFRFRAGDLSTSYGVRPDLWVLGKVLGGGMPVAAVAGREDVLRLGTRASRRVKFEGGTYSAHELSLVAARTLLRHVREHEDEIYPALGRLGTELRESLARVGEQAGLALHLPDPPAPAPHGSSLVLAHALKEGAPPPSSPEDLCQAAHPHIDERLLRSTLLLEDLSVRTGLGAVSTAHSADDLARTIESYRAGLQRMHRADLF